MKIKTQDIVYREDLYPRFEPDQKTIQKYSDSVDYLPPIKLDQHNILIDGYHRWKAYQLAGIDEIPYELIEVSSEKELKILAYQYNSNHGIQLKNDEKKKFANEMIGDMAIEDIVKILSVSQRIIYDWTKNKREELKQERDRLIVEDYLRAENTQEALAEKYGITKDGISKIIQKYNNCNSAKIIQNFKPFIYNIWNTQKGNETNHFGSFPKIFMDNLLYFHTNPLDIVFDPFAGAGTTIDSCKDFYRRYYCTDRIVKPGREKDIKQHDILNGFPEGLPKPEMIFLDPPYWVLAKEEYSKDETDLGNMTKDVFYETMNNIIADCKKRKINKIAYLIRPIWEFGDETKWIDPMFDLYDMASDKYKIEARYVIPYSTEQYRATMVEKAKENKYCLILNRELTILRLR